MVESVTPCKVMTASPALVLRETAPSRRLDPVGLKTTGRLQLAPAATVAQAVGDGRLKSAAPALTVALEMASVAVPTFWMTMFCGALALPRVWEANSR